MLALLCVMTIALTAPPEAREVEFDGHEGMRLMGTLLVPANVEGQRPAVLLLPGSGPTDRDGNQPPIMINLLRQLADALAEEGVVTLRFDKRAAHVYAPRWPRDLAEVNEFFSWEAFTGDARAAYEWLARQPEVDPKRILILGHSEGGLIALQIAADLPDDRRPAGLILMGTAGRQLSELIREQLSNLLRAQGVPEHVHDEYMGHVERAIRQLRETATVPDDLPVGLRPVFNPTAAKLLQTYMTLDPAELATRYNGPVLILNGEHDAQVSAERDAARLAEAFRQRAEGAGEVELVIIEGASHNFKAVAGPRELGLLGPVVEPAGEAARRFGARVGDQQQ